MGCCGGSCWRERKREDPDAMEGYIPVICVSMGISLVELCDSLVSTSCLPNELETRWRMMIEVRSMCLQMDGPHVTRRVQCLGDIASRCVQDERD